MRLRFPKAARLTRSSEFALLKKEGSSFHGRFMVLSVLRPESKPATRIGIITSRRVGGAVIRTRVRRQLRELFRHSRPNLCEGLWLVVVARQHAARATFAELSREWNDLLKRSKALTGDSAMPCVS